MLNPLKQAGEMAKMVKQAKQMQKMMEEEEVVVEEGPIRIVIDGTQKIKKFSVNSIENEEVVKALNKAIKKSQQAGAKRMQEMAGGLSGIMGMLGK